MKKAILILMIFFCAQSASAACDIKELGLGEKFSTLKEKYKFNDDGVGAKKYYKNIRGKHICDELGNAEISILFIKDKIAQIQVYKISNNPIILKLASKAFGEPAITPNVDDPDLHSYSTFWDKDKNVMAYNFSFNGNKKTFTEKLTIQNKELAEDIRNIASVDEDKEEDK